MATLPTLLLTRPAAQSARFAAQARAAFDPAPVIVIAPVLAIEFCGGPISATGYSGLVFTSENAVESFLVQSDRSALPAWCVGAQTAARARAAGLAPRVAGGDGAALVARILAERPRGKLLYLHGAERRVDIAAQLNSAGLETDSKVIYRQIAQPLTAPAIALLAGAAPVVVPLFSPRSARVFRDAVPLCRAPLTTVSISPACDAELAGWSGIRRLVAARPEADAIMDTLRAVYAAAASA